MKSRPFLVIGIGFGLVLLGFVIPLLEVMQILTSTFALNFISYAASTAGLILGIVGAALYVSFERRKRHNK